jgi:hypothetical protein
MAGEEHQQAIVGPMLAFSKNACGDRTLARVSFSFSTRTTVKPSARSTRDRLFRSSVTRGSRSIRL